MTDLWTKLKQRKLVQWVLAYVAFAFALLQAVDIVATRFGWPTMVERILIIVLCVGFILTLILAWYHGEQGRQRISGTELLILTLVLAVGGGFLWQYTRVPHAANTVGGKPATANNAHSPAVTKKQLPETSTAAIPAKSIAVLPFENLSADEDNKYFADGMQDLILTKLADIGELKVISRTSTLQYGSHPQNLKKVGLELGVATLLEGSVQKAGNQVLINVQLINSQTDAHIWAQAYTRTLDNVFGVEGEVAEKIADALKTKLSPSETKRLATALSNDPAANDLYLYAEYYANRGLGLSDPIIGMQALPLYRQAIARVPDFALARAHLSQIESWLAFNGGAGNDVRQLDADALAQAEQALKLAPDQADAYLAMGYYDYYGRGDYDAALKAFTTALRIRPNDADTYAAQGYVLRRQGRFDEAINAFKQALIHDPRSTISAAALGETYRAVGRYLDAEQALQRALALDPGNDFARAVYATVIFRRTGDLNRALAETQGNSNRLKASRASLLVFQHKYSTAITLTESIHGMSTGFRGTSAKNIRLGDLYHYSGDEARARTYYAKALPELRAHLSEESNHPLAVAWLWSKIAAAEMGLGKKDAGIAAIKASLAASEQSRDRLSGPGIVETAAENYARAGLADKAVPLLEKVFATPGGRNNYAPLLLWFDPIWDPIHKTPEFQALLKKYAASKPASISTEAGGD